jgi:hypothetical protein
MRFDSAFYLKEKTKLSKPIKRVSGCFVFFVMVVFILSPLNSARAEDHQGDHDVKQRLKNIEEIEEKEDEEEREGALSPIIQEIFGEKVKLNGGFEFNYEYLDVEDIGDENSGSSSDFYGLDISLSVYKSPQVIENLQNFDTHEWRSGRQKEDKFRSFIANITLEPLEDTLTLSAFYDNEPGDGSRNQSIGGAFTLSCWKFSLDAEYVTALEREKGANGAENKESAAVVGIALDALDSLQLATRYGVFDDDNPADQDEVLEYQISAGFNYSLLDVADFFFLTDAVFSFEYRYSNYEKESDSKATNSQNMFMFQLMLGF